MGTGPVGQNTFGKANVSCELLVYYLKTLTF